MSCQNEDIDKARKKLNDYTNFEDKNEEFNNFMHRVTEVSHIVQKLSSHDKKMQEIGTLEAERYLNDNNRDVDKSIDEDLVELKIKSDRTVLNKRAFVEEKKDDGTMSAGKCVGSP